jgi:hypothetical protein
MRDMLRSGAATRCSGLSRSNRNIMNRNSLYLVIGALVVVAVVFGYQLYQDRQKTTGVEINVGRTGISIEKK